MAYLLKENNPKLSWGNIANESGYFDQMHLIHDFKAFAGYSPCHLRQLEHQNLKILSILEENTITH